MAGELFGQAGGLAYDIPQRFGLQQPVAQEAAAQEAEAPEPLSPLQIGDGLLAEREKLTDDYYNNYGILDAYVKDMTKKGVDPFVPDYTQPGGGEVFKTLQRLKANFYHGANALQTQREDEKVTNQAIIENKIKLRDGVDTQGFYADDMSNFRNMQLDPQAVELNKYAITEFKDQAEVDRAIEANYKPIIDGLLQKRQQVVAAGGDPSDIDRQIQSYVKPNKVDPSTDIARISAAARTAAGKDDYNLDVLKKYYNIGSGHLPEGSYSMRTDPVHGKVFVYNGVNGANVGSWPDAKHVLHEKVIKDVIVTPEGKTFVSYVDPAIPQEQVKDPQEFAQNIMSNNAKLGDYAKAMKAAAENQMVNEGGGLIDEKIRDPRSGEYKEKRTAELGTSDKDVLKSVEADKDKLKGLKPGFFWNDSFTFETPQGAVEVKVTNDGKYDIDNFDEIWPGEDDPAKFSNLTMDEIAKKLNDLGRYNDVAPIEVPTPVATQEEEYTTANNQSYTREELKAAGWSDAQIAKLPKKK